MKPLKPVMAALLAASSAFAAPGISYAIDTPPSAPAKNSTAATDENPINVLTALVKSDPQARKDIGERLAAFLQGKDAAGGQYLTAGLQGDAKLLPAAVQIAKDWPEKNKATPDRVAILYFIMGPGDGPLPAWAQASVLSKSLKPGADWSKQLSIKLADRKWTAEKRIPQSGAADATTGFLEDAADQADKILNDPRTMQAIRDSVGANATTKPNPPEEKPDNNGVPLDPATGNGFGFDDLYKRGAEVQNVFAPGDKGYRTLSMKVYTTDDGNGNMISRIGIVDITAGDITSPSLPRFIDVSKPGESEITLRDGGRRYNVKVGSDGTVTLTRPGAKAEDPGSMVKTVSTLLADRNDQITRAGVVTIGGNPYYVIGQGGIKGSFLFFSKAQMDAGTGNPHPELQGDVVQVLGDGSSSPIKGKPTLGTLQNGDAYHLEFDMATRIWKVLPGIGDVKDDKPKKATDAKDPAAKDPAAKDPAKTPGQQDQTTTTGPDMSSAKTLDDVIAILTKDKTWAEDAANDGFDGATKAQVRILSNAKDGQKNYDVAFDPSLGIKNNSFAFKAENNGVKLFSIRGLGKYIAMDYSTNAQYFDVANFVKYIQQASDPSLSYAQAGSFASSNGQMQNVTDVEIMADILTHSLKVKSDDPMIATLRARVKKNVKPGAGYTINGNLTTIYLGSGEMGMNIWPEEKASGDKGGSNANMTGLRGPGTAVGVSGGAPEEFKAEMDSGSGRVSTRVQMSADKHAAIYTAEEDENVDGKIEKARMWYIMLDYKKNGLDSRSKALPVFGGKNRYQLPSGVQIQGLQDLDLPDSTQLMMQYGSNQERGAIAAYRFVLPDAQGGQNAKDKKGNCAGPVIWWGDVTKEQAQKACESDSKIR